jgi:hypothetical protein
MQWILRESEVFIWSILNTKLCLYEELPGFIFSRGSIYLLRIYWDLLAVSVFQPTHTHTLTLTKPSPSLSGGKSQRVYNIYKDPIEFKHGIDNGNKSYAVFFKISQKWWFCVFQLKIIILNIYCISNYMK